MKKVFCLHILFIVIISCSNQNTDLIFNLVKIDLSGDLAEKNFEASGLAWYKDYLIILPQFPHKWDKQYDGAIYFISQKRILSYLNGEDKNPIIGEKIHFIANNLDEIGKRNGSGYEAITFINDTLYVSIESVNDNLPSSFIVKGIIDFTKRQIILDKSTQFEIKSQTNIHNMGEETILNYDNFVYAIHEANGQNIKKEPFATKLNKNFLFSEKIKMPNIDFRITDATNVDSIGKFYALNYYYPGEFLKLKPNIKNKDIAIEQILELQIINNQIIRTDKTPIKISNLNAKNGRNWEGIVRLNNGFLIITDMFPETIMAYYKSSNNSFAKLNIEIK